MKIPVEPIVHMFKGVGVEIGVDLGVSTKLMAEYGLRIIGVDPYGLYDERKDQAYQDKRKQQMLSNLRLPLETGQVKILYITSIEAAKQFKNNSLDFVFIDGDHTAPAVYSDIITWHPKVKKGGILAGHDYQIVTPFHQVGQAVDRWKQENNALVKIREACWYTIV